MTGSSPGRVTAPADRAQRLTATSAGGYRCNGHEATVDRSLRGSDRGAGGEPRLGRVPAGRNGLLAVAPLKGAGVLLVKPGAGSESRICASGPGCQRTRAARDGHPTDRRWRSPRPMAGESRSCTATGSCLDCQPFTAARPAAHRQSDAVDRRELRQAVRVPQRRLGEEGASRRRGLRTPSGQLRGISRSCAAGACSPAPPAGFARSVRGSSPSWSPRGTELAVVRGGWVTVLGVARRSSRRVVKGSAPAWSPDGKSIAFIAAGHRLSMVAGRWEVGCGGSDMSSGAPSTGSRLRPSPRRAAWRHPDRPRWPARAPLQ